MALILLLFIFLLIFGTPIVFSLGVAASFTLVAYDVPLALVAQKIYGGLDKFTIMAIPFFILTGIILLTQQKLGTHCSQFNFFQIIFFLMCQF